MSQTTGIPAAQGHVFLQDNILRFLFKELQIATGTTDMPAGIWQKEEGDFRERVGEGVPWMAMTSVHKF